ncbi:DapH/DapD/GlmU-related protein, partial [Cronobacter sakazakii]
RACVGHDCVIGENSVVSGMVALAGHCVVGERVFIGMNSCVKEQTRIGDDAIVGMGSAVFSDVADATIVLGNPARAMRQNTEGKVFK